MQTSDEAPVSSKRKAPEPRCPRCGGLTEKPKRRGRSDNPFLRDQVTCVDCGLDFEPESAWPW